MSSSLMAEDECEVELRDMVTEVLENNGVLSKLRAQLRASVFLALDETGGGGDQTERFQSAALRSAAARPAGRRSLALVRELLACLQLDCTLSVLDAELESVAGWREERPRLAAALSLTPSSEEEPLLVTLLSARGGGSGASGSSGGTASPPAADPEPSADGSRSDEEDSFFDSLPKVRSAGASRSAAEPPPQQAAASQTARKREGEMFSSVTTRRPESEPSSSVTARRPESDLPLSVTARSRPESELTSSSLSARRADSELPSSVTGRRQEGELTSYLTARRPEGGELPPLSGRGTLPPLRHGQLPSLSAPAPAPALSEAESDRSISEELEPAAGDSILSELQSDGLTDDVSINSAADLRADHAESM